MEPEKTGGSPMTDRLGKIERTQRGLIVAVVLLSTAATVVLFAGASRLPQETVMASRFVLMGKDGRVRGALGIDKDGVASLSLLGPNGGPIPISLSVSPNGKPAINLNDRDGHSIVLMIGEAPSVSVNGPDENAITLRIDEKDPTLILGDRKGQIGMGRRRGADYLTVVVKDGGNVLFRTPAPPAEKK
jgi:hypothetical protein